MKFVLRHLGIPCQFKSKEDLESHLEMLYASNEFSPKDVDSITDESGKEYTISVTVVVEPT